MPPVKYWEIIADRLDEGAGVRASPNILRSADWFFVSMHTAAVAAGNDTVILLGNNRGISSIGLVEVYN